MLSRTSCLSAVATAFAASIIALAQAPQGSPARLIGRVVDTSGTAIRGATVILSRPGGETVAITTTTGNGDYALPALPPADYLIQGFAVGFGPSRLSPLNLESGKDAKQDISMDIGFARNAPMPTGRIGVLAGVAPGGVRGASGIATAADNPSRLRIGGNEATGNLIRQSEPEYPPLAKQARVQGSVIIEVVIGADGGVKELKVINGHPLLQKAAIDAVSTWLYRPFVINGQATEAITTVTVTFSLPQ